MQTINLRGKEYPILFDARLAAKVQKRYGSVEEIGNKLDDIDELIWIMTQLINEGLLLTAFENHVSVETLTEDTVGAIMTIKSLKSNEIAQKVIDAFNESMGNEKNLTAEELMKISEAPKIN